MNNTDRTFLIKVIDKLRAWMWKFSIAIRTAPLRLHYATRPTTMASTKDRSWRYSTPTRETWIRAKTMFKKEPETINWLDSFSEGKIFWDIGASVGTFSLYAASTKGANVVSFEPMPNTYAVLVENILTNRLNSQIEAFCISLSDHTDIGTLYITSTVAGTSEHNIHRKNDTPQSAHRYQTTQSSLCYTIDDFIDQFSIRPPNYIKIDVDGNENKILRGARRTLKSVSLRSILLEIDENNDVSKKEISGILTAEQFYLETKVAIKKGPTNTMFNYVFSRI